MRLLEADGAEGLAIPKTWFFWPGEADSVYQARLDQWRSDHAHDQIRPIPRRNITCVVFLDVNMPAELRGCSEEELASAGVRQVPADAAVEFILGRYEADHGVRLSDAEEGPYLRGYLEAIGASSDG